MTVYRHVFWHIFLLALLCMPLVALSQSVAHAQTQTQDQAQQNDIPVSDLGIREQGQTYPLKLTAVNVDCDAPQDFEFEIDNTPWLTTSGNPVAKGLGPGQRRSLPAQLDFTYTPPGVYYGHVTSRCTSCGWFIFASCFENGQDVVLKVTVADPADPQNGVNLPQTPNPYAGMKPYVPSTIALNPPITTSDESLLTAEERNRLYVSRSRVKAAQRRGEQARDGVRAARLKKNDCERELARLKAAMEAANQTAATADQDAANAEGAAKAAEKELAEFDEDVRKAEIAAELARQYLATAVFALNHHARTLGKNSKQYKESEKLFKENQEKKRAADRALKEIKASKSNRQAAADEARRQANAAKAAAARARSNANAATARYNAKARECLGITAAKAEADKKLLDAENAAKHAVGIANYEEGEAKKKADIARSAAQKRGLKKLKEDIEKEKNRKKKCETEVKEYANYLTRMFKAIRDLTKMDNRKITDADINVETTAVDMAKEFVRAAAATGAAGIMPTGETAFGALKAGYDIIKLKQLENTSGKGLFRGNDILGDKLKDEGYAKTNAEGDKMALDMEKWAEAKGDPSFFQSELREKILRCNKITERIKELEAQQAAAKK